MDRVQERASGAGDCGATAPGASRGGVVIAVADVEPAGNPMPDMPYRLAVDAVVVQTSFESQSDGTTPIEACSDEGGRLISTPGTHAGLAAVHFAYARHTPLVLSPDIVWMFITHGVAQHVNANAESLRRRFVRHEGRLDLEVRRDEFIKGSPHNDWAGVFDEFSALIRAHIGETTHALFEPRFSTTGAVEKAAAQIALLDAMQAYFRYRVGTLCGIPEIVLQGTPRDWASLAERTQALREFELEWWTDALHPILARFVAAAGGAADAAFWRTIYKRTDGSGGPYISGWITAFFPYLHRSLSRDQLVINPALRDGGEYLREMLSGTGPEMGGLTTDCIPSGLASAPFEWQYLRDRYDMRFVAGFVGVRQDPETFSVRPEIGWAVYDAAQVEAARAVRETEYLRLEHEASDRAFDRAAAWVWKGLCPGCGEWIYRYQDDPPSQHCGSTLVNVSKRG